ncbi:zinc finger domain-containing protein [Streptomyces sp. NPDC003032]
MTDLTPNDLRRKNLPPLAVACPDCGSAAGELCTSHGGTRARNSQVHRGRSAAWNQARIDGNPTVRLILDATKTRRGMHGTHAAELLDAHGHTTEAERIRRALSEQNGLLSAKQAAALILDEAEGGKTQ